MDYVKEYDRWMRYAGADTRAELSALPREEAEERFYRELEFGTAGLRALIGAGTNRINRFVVRRATKGLSDYLRRFEGADERGVVIAYDSRRCSEAFAREAALTLAKCGQRAYLFESLRAVPQLSFAVRHLNCIAGIAITASHNPAAYNGYKVYWEHGGQLGPAEADAVYDAMRTTDYFDVTPMDESEAIARGLLVMIGEQVDEAYYAATQSLLLRPEMVKDRGASLKLVYTPLHGAGNIPVRELLSRVGMREVHVVKEQELPDAAFPTVGAPNPEDPKAFALAGALAERVGADVILATDPDSDRLGVAIRGADGGFVVLTGNQIGCLLLEYIICALSEQGRLPENGFAAKSIVSTRLADAICARYGIRLETVLTGFRFISEKIDEAERTGSGAFLFGFEESYGFLAGGFSRDKDAICSAMLIAEACAYYFSKNATLSDALEEIYKKYGYYKESVKSYTLAGKEGMEKIAGAMRRLRETPLLELAGVRVASSEDYLSGIGRELSDGCARALTLPHADMVRFLFQNGAWLVVRPSGTEPKLKLYIGANDTTAAAVDALLAAFMREADALISAYLSV